MVWMSCTYGTVCQWYFTLQVFYKTLEQLILCKQLSSIPTFHGSMLLIFVFGFSVLGFILPSSCVLCPMLLVSLDCQLVTTPVVFSNFNCRMRVHKTTNILLEKPTRIYVIRSTFLSFSAGFSCTLLFFTFV